MIRLISTFAMTVLLSLAVSAATASIAPPYSYTKPTADGRYLFVMLAPGSFEDDLSDWIEEKAQEIRQIRSNYAESGLYRNDGTSNAIWTVDWYEYDVEPLSDGVHLVRPGPWATSSDTEGVAFFANGKLIRSYTVGDLVAIPALMPRISSQFNWRRDEWLDEDAKTYNITTLHGERYTFDVTTGEIISSFSPTLMVLTVTILLVAGAFGHWMWRRRKDRE